MITRRLSAFAPAFGLLLVVSLALGVSSQEQPAAPSHPQHVVVDPADIEWGPAPDALPEGAELATLFGDSSKEGGSRFVRSNIHRRWRNDARSAPRVCRHDAMQASWWALNAVS